MPKQEKQWIRRGVPFDHTEMMRVLNELVFEYPFFNLSYLGASILENPIPIVTVGSGRREVLYVGAHHGMEWITSALLCQFLHDLGDSVTKKRTIRRVSPSIYLELYKINVIPMLNPDGVSYQIHGINVENPLYERLIRMNPEGDDFSKWQSNARGVDLNHNYDAGFWKYKKLEAENGITDGAPTRYSGEYPESEPEVAALCNWIRYHQYLRGIITLHTQGEEVYYRSGDKCAPNAPAVAYHVARLSGYRLSEAEGLASYGGLTDWCAADEKIPCFTLECGRGINPLPLSDVDPIYSDLRNLFFTFPSLV